ncbi:GNAT family N-acetyltransferase [Shimia aestuarii]|uniref:Ribosomal protein S18 acetylase RimI n=1 Tax=Shimia aestuarii TaxID=254406 RepID=A0A1I4LID5_9RHOB|nr:GNAT family N-acetyltransferase [Shimia aestuarii]SFL90794.1 Ribosomal protein S18 acetylase RimI [Shimia aestuarii]
MQTLRPARHSDANRCFALETAAYGGPEAASLERISKRIANYPRGFLVLEIDGNVVGFINSGCARDVEMSDDAFKELIGHDPDAPNVVILSVVVDPAHQGTGLSRALMVEFIARMQAMGKETIHLICKEHHVPLYERFGYAYDRPSASNHGGKTWHEMSMQL